jgi:uncharacterized membrane protein
MKEFLARHEWLRKSVTIPVKLLLVFLAAVFVLVVALAISKRVEPRVTKLLSAEKVVAPLDAVSAAIALERLEAHISATCKQPAPVKSKPIIVYKTKKDVLK